VFTLPNILTINNLPAGTYRIEVIDDNHDCYKAMSDHVALYNNATGPGYLSIYAVPVPASGCTASGSLFIDVRGGSGNFKFTLNGEEDPPLVDGMIENLLPGPYVVGVIDNDSPYCTATSDEVWIHPASPVISIEENTRIHTECGESTGVAVYTISSTNQYYWQWHGGPVERWYARA
jgi:hypothetical protein